ncbi:hypothetical protein RclHR1_11460006 [Rhizophagus clarus]|uniref:Uncharacterized protein n=1 Tax=Rhizophagus clarus TaxID=94130 RepID=A0A2Z6QGJ0_9GLOM|nr:hypothetical protein RclHR1_11460006 [Rhizophagus clarus]
MYERIDNYNFASPQPWSSPCPICDGKHGNYGLHSEWYKNETEYCLTCFTSSNKFKFAIIPIKFFERYRSETLTKIIYLCSFGFCRFRGLQFWSYDHFLCNLELALVSTRVPTIHAFFFLPLTETNGK